jgi:hypothetical protein
MIRKSFEGVTEEFLLGDELVSFEFIRTVAHAQSIPLANLANANVGHQHKRRDEDSDELWAELRKFLATGEYPTRCNTDKSRVSFIKRARRYILHQDRLWLAPKRKSSALPRLVIENRAKRGELMARAHNDCGHRGRDAVYAQLRDRFYWPNMYDDTTYFVRSCIECQKSIKKIPVIPYNESWQAPLLRHFNLDCIHMPSGVQGYSFIVQAIEPTILWPEARSLKELTARGVARFIYEEIICRFACVPFISFDGGSEFKGEVLELLRTLYNCTVIFSTAYHPQGNAPIERAHQPLVDALFKCTGDAKGNWPLYLKAVLFAMRVTVSRATGFSPYYLLYGVHPIFSFDITEITWQTLDWDKVHTHEELLAIRARQLSRRDPKMREANDRLRESRRRAIEDMHRRNHFMFDFTDFEEGMYVWLRESQYDETKGDKGKWLYSGPYVIHEKREHDSFVLRELSGAILKGHVNIRRLRLFYFRPSNQTLKTSLKPRFRKTEISNIHYRLDHALMNLAYYTRDEANALSDHFDKFPLPSDCSFVHCH